MNDISSTDEYQKALDGMGSDIPIDCFTDDSDFDPIVKKRSSTTVPNTSSYHLNLTWKPWMLLLPFITIGIDNQQLVSTATLLLNLILHSKIPKKKSNTTSFHKDLKTNNEKSVGSLLYCGFKPCMLILPFINTKLSVLMSAYCSLTALESYLHRRYKSLFSVLSLLIMTDARKVAEKNLVGNMESEKCLKTQSGKKTSNQLITIKYSSLICLLRKYADSVDNCGSDQTLALIIQSHHLLRTFNYFQQIVLGSHYTVVSRIFHLQSHITLLRSIKKTLQDDEDDNVPETHDKNSTFTKSLRLILIRCNDAIQSDSSLSNQTQYDLCKTAIHLALRDIESEFIKIQQTPPVVRVLKRDEHIHVSELPLPDCQSGDIDRVVSDFSVDILTTTGTQPMVPMTDEDNSVVGSLRVPPLPSNFSPKYPLGFERVLKDDDPVSDKVNHTASEDSGLHFDLQNELKMAFQTRQQHHS